MSTVKERDLDNIITFPTIFARDSMSKPWLELFKPSTHNYKGRQKTVSSGHHKNRSGKYDSGGPFFTNRIDPGFTPRSVSLLAKGSSGWRKYDGPITMRIPDTGYSGFTPPSEDDLYLDKVGAEAISIVDPTNPNASTGVALGEILHDRRLSLPFISAWRRRTEVAQAAGSEYLAAQFGWLPLLSDVKNTAQSIRDGNTILQNYRAASGTLVHREFAFDDIVTESESVINAGTRCNYSASSNVVAFNGSPVPLTQRSVTTKKRWFSGSFTYAANQASPLGKCLGVGSEIDKLFGLTLTPDVLWELTPWSWAIDWFSNAGNVLSNVTSFGLAGLVMKYGYIMEETSTVNTYSMPATGLAGVTGTPPDAIVTNVTKRRRQADPFGFGVGWEGLSPTQLAITAALGITRLR